MSNPADLLTTGQRVLARNYAPGKLGLVHGEGSRVFDTSGRDYIDLGTGISVTSFGHRHPEIERAVRAQLDALWHVSNLYYNEPAVQLAVELTETSFAERVFFCNSGSEATEAAIKLVRRAASATRSPQQRDILTFEGGFHGRTLAAVTATAQPKYHAGFEPLPGGFRYCPFNDVDALAEQFDDNVCAVLVEPVQGEGGIVPAAPGFLKHVRELCDAHGALMIADEVQCGLLRTGKLWAHQWEDGVLPDVMTLAKALGGGLPLGAMLVGRQAADILAPGSHGSTFGGNPVVCAGARVALHLAQRPALIGNVAHQGHRLHAALVAMQEKTGAFREVRGRGLMLGAQMHDEHKEKLGALVDACLARGVIVLTAGGNVLRFLPPLNIDDATLNEAIEKIDDALNATLA
ncbi:MAG: aspartate aminotransferase family protein [Gammaproteobacteria bacterium]